MSRPTLPSRPRILWPVTAFLCAVATLIALVVPGVAIPSAAAASSVTFEAAADATATQVSQDGNGNTTAQSTLATCPQLCDGNAQGRRDAVVEFAVTGLPAGARVTGATLRLYSWSAYPATSTVRPASAERLGVVNGRPWGARITRRLRLGASKAHRGTHGRSPGAGLPARHC